MRVFAVDRRHRILERVAVQQTIHIAELAQELGVSEMTIRRDISRLERDGFLRRTYGGGTPHITRSVEALFKPRAPGPRPRSMELLFNARALANAQTKRRLGMRVAETLEQASTIFIGIGSTAEQ